MAELDNKDQFEVIWQSDYEMPAQCGATDAVDTLQVTGYADGSVMADYSPCTGKEINKDFRSVEQALEWIHNFFFDGDLVAVGDFDFMTDLP